MPVLTIAYAVAAFLSLYTANAPTWVSRPPSSPLAKLLIQQGYTAIPLTPSTVERCHLVRVKLNGTPFTLMVDTGASASFVLTPEAGKALGFQSDTYTWDTDPRSPTMRMRKYGYGMVSRAEFIGAKYEVQDWHYAQVLDDFPTVHSSVYDPILKKDKGVYVHGLLGQAFLLQHSAVIDSDTSLLFLMPLAKKDGLSLIGQWECVGGEKNGKPLKKPTHNHIELRSDMTMTAKLAGKKVVGRMHFQRADTRRLLMVGFQDDEGKSNTLLYGMYEFNGDRLKLCLLEKPSNLDDKDKITVPPMAFEAKANSGHVYYEFIRK